MEHLGKLEVFFFELFRELLEYVSRIGRYSETLNKIALSSAT